MLMSSNLPINAIWSKHQDNAMPSDVEVKIIGFSHAQIGTAGIRPVAIVQEPGAKPLRFVELKFLTVKE